MNDDKNKWIHICCFVDNKIIFPMLQEVKAAACIRMPKHYFQDNKHRNGYSSFTVSVFNSKIHFAFIQFANQGLCRAASTSTPIFDSIQAVTYIFEFWINVNMNFDHMIIMK